jgi:outer membrane protein
MLVTNNNSMARERALVTSFLNRFAAVALFLAFAVPLTHAREIRVAVVTDGPSQRQGFSAAVIEREIANVAATDLDIRLPEDKRFTGDWSLEGASAALDRALADKSVDVVLTLGILGSHQAAHRASLPKPVIAPLVVDPVLQGYPLNEGRSGKRNFAYAADFQSVGNEVRAFHDIVGFKHMAALVDGSLMAALPQLAGKAEELAAALNTRITIVRVAGDVPAALAAIPADADAVYVTPLRFNEAGVTELARGLAARKIPTFTVVGRSEVEAGMLMTTGGAERDTERLARRILLMIQRIAGGEDPARFEVSFPTEQRLVFNMRVARDIGFSPGWKYLADSEQLHLEVDGSESLTLLDAMRIAVERNPALEASRARLASTADEVRIARSSLLPSLSASGARTRIDADRASPLTQAEDSTSAGLSFSQVLYSERAWAGLAISRSLLAAEEQSQRTDLLDTLNESAGAYLNVLRAKSVEVVRRRNVENTRKNLETSRVREEVGLGGRSDYLRWVAQLARDKQNLLAAESSRRQAETELARILHRDARSSFVTVESGLDDPLSLVASGRTQAFLDTPARWNVFMDYAVQTALTNSPEIAQTSALVTARERALKAATRAYYLPELALVSNGSRVSDRSGAGSLSQPGAPDDESWSVTLQATFPIFTSGLRGAERSQARHDLREMQAQRSVATDGVEARTRVVLHRTASSWPAIDLSREAAAAADENLVMVADAYARGAVSVTDLIDAQEAALSAGLAATDAKYGFMIDFVNVLRAMGEFEILLDPASREAWYGRVENWFRTHGAVAK